MAQVKKEIEVYNDILSELKYERDRYKKKLDENLEKLKENYYYYFSWLGSETYTADVMFGYYKKMHDMVEHRKDDFKEDMFNLSEYLKLRIEEHKEYCSKAYNVRTKSTSELTNIASTLLFEAKLELIEKLEQYLNRISKAN